MVSYIVLDGSVNTYGRARLESHSGRPNHADRKNNLPFPPVLVPLNGSVFLHALCRDGLNRRNSDSTPRHTSRDSGSSSPHLHAIVSRRLQRFCPAPLHSLPLTFY